MIAFLLSLLIECRATHGRPVPFRLVVDAPAHIRFDVRPPVDWGIFSGAALSTG